MLISGGNNVFIRLLLERQLYVCWAEKRWLKNERVWGVMSSSMSIMLHEPIVLRVPLYIPTRVALQALKVVLKVRGL
jgi:hypothetical protein